MPKELGPLSIHKNVISQIAELLTIDLQIVEKAVSDYLKISANPESSLFIAPDLQALFSVHMSRRHATAFAGVIMGLIRLKETLSFPPDVILGGFRDVVMKDETIQPYKEKIGPFFSILEKIVTDERAYEIYKASELFFELDETITSARIITEARPVFSRKADVIKGCIIRNVLRIGIEHGDTREELIFSLSFAQINDLIEQLERAKTKTETFMLSLKQLTPRIAIQGLKSNE